MHQYRENDYNCSPNKGSQAVIRASNTTGSSVAGAVSRYTSTQNLECHNLFPTTVVFYRQRNLRMMTRLRFFTKGAPDQARRTTAPSRPRRQRARSCAPSTPRAAQPPSLSRVCSPARPGVLSPPVAPAAIARSTDTCISWERRVESGGSRHVSGEPGSVDGAS